MIEISKARNPQKSKINMPHSHYHDQYEIYCFLGERMTYFIDNRSYQLEKGDMILVDKYVYHKTFYNNNIGNERINILFGDDFLARFFDDTAREEIFGLFQVKRYRIRDGHWKERITDTILRMSDLYLLQNNVLHAGLLLADLLWTLLELNENKRLEEEYPELTPAQQRTARIIEYINAHYAEPITLQTLADQFFISKFYLSRTFSSQTGLSVTDFINRKRLGEASILLKKTQTKIAKIALTCGFSNLSHFSQMFKKIYRVAPREYRKK